MLYHIRLLGQQVKTQIAETVPCVHNGHVWVVFKQLLSSNVSVDAPRQNNEPRAQNAPTSITSPRNSI